MKRLFLAFGVLLLIGAIGAAVWLRANRLDLAASRDLQKFASSNSSALYTHYPQLIDLIAADPDLAARVERVHLSVGSFDTSAFNGRDFSSLKDLPNLRVIEVTYAYNTDRFMPTVNSISTLRSAMFAYCAPREAWMDSLDSPSLRNLHIHDHSDDMPEQALERLSLRMPHCEIKITSD